MEKRNDRGRKVGMSPEKRTANIHLSAGRSKQAREGSWLDYNEFQAFREWLEPRKRRRYYIPINTLRLSHRFLHIAILSVLASVLVAGCDAGLEPPEDEGTGTITGTITYVGQWPPASELQDLRFIAMRFIPSDTTDFFRLNEMVISARLPDNVSTHEFSLPNAPAGTYFYAGVAQKYADDLLAWRPVGLVETGGGAFTVHRGGSVHVSVEVDFAHPPIFPPQ